MNDVVKTYLQMTSIRDFAPAFLNDHELQIDLLHPCPSPLYRMLYQDIGKDFSWTSRLDWCDDQLDLYLAQGNVKVLVLRRGIAIAGFCELVILPGMEYEIKYLGLLEQYRGQGLGKHLLSAVVEKAWEMGATRIFLNTSSADSGAALPNYIRRGFRRMHTQS